MSCSELSAAEPLAGSAAVATRFLLLEHRGRWGRDALDGTELTPDVGARAEAFDGRVLLIRRPSRESAEPAAFVAEVQPAGGLLTRVRQRVDAPGEIVAGQLLLVCVHGRRDACCARLGVPVFEALLPHVAEDGLWQSSHHGGHRFAANVLALPAGVQLGRVPPSRAEQVAALLSANRIPLDIYRGRTLDEQRSQVADAEVRRTRGLDGISDVRPLRDDGEIVEVAVLGDVVRVRVDEAAGPPLPPSCGADPEPSRRLLAAVV